MFHFKVCYLVIKRTIHWVKKHHTSFHPSHLYNITLSRSCWSTSVVGLPPTLFTQTIHSFFPPHTAPLYPLPTQLVTSRYPIITCAHPASLTWMGGRAACCSQDRVATLCDELFTSGNSLRHWSSSRLSAFFFSSFRTFTYLPALPHCNGHRDTL